MSEFSSVLELAREVASEANRIKSGRKAEETAVRVLNRVGETRVALQKLEQAVAAARRLVEVSGATSIDLTGLDDGHANLERLALQSSYLPSDPAFAGARKRIGDITRRVTRDVEQAWADWARQAVAGVASIKISQLDPMDQAAARTRWDALVKVSRVSSPKTDEVNSFKSDLDYLHEVLNPLPNLPDRVRDLYDQLGRRPYLTLAEVTDEQVVELREAGVAVHIELRRRGA